LRSQGLLSEMQKIIKMSNKKESVAMSSVFASLALTIIKFFVGILTGSMGIISEAAHSLLDFFAAGMTYFAVKFSDKPADESHPYGHGKIESISALAETGLLFMTSGWIIYESIHRLIAKNIEVEATWYAFAVIILAIIVDISRSRALLKVANQTKSQALEADALHFSSDVWSSSVVLLGLVFVLLGIKGADAIAAIGVSIFVAIAGWRLGKRTLSVLVDTAPKGISDEATEIAKKTSGVVGVERVRVRSLGPNVFIEMIVQVSRKFSVAKAQEIVKNIEEEIKNKIPGADTLIRANSVHLGSETIIEAIQALAAKNNVSVHEVVVDILDNKQYISYDLELPDTLTISKAHEIATVLEKDVKEELGSGIELNSHIEPLKNETILSSNITEEEMQKVVAVISEVDQEVKEISDLHNVLVRKIGEKFFVSFHCLSPGDLSLETVHNITSKFEYLMREKMKEIKRVVIHTEPK
jgi:cation diffusion facilitator family transporter